MTPRHVLELKCWVPVPRECVILNVPLGNTAVSTLLPGWSTPPAVNSPVAMMLAGGAGLALAAVSPVPATAPATATTLIPVRTLLLSFVIVHTSRDRLLLRSAVG